LSGARERAPRRESEAMEITTKQKLEDFIKESAKNSAMELFAAFREEQEKRAAEER
jgi:hypothetical protein